MSFVLKFLVRAFPSVVEPVAEIIDEAKRPSDPEIGSVHSERARELKQKLAEIAEQGPSAIDDISAALVVAQDLLRGMTRAVADDVNQAATGSSAAARQWVWSLFQRALREGDDRDTEP